MDPIDLVIRNPDEVIAERKRIEEKRAKAKQLAIERQARARNHFAVHGRAFIEAYCQLVESYGIEIDEGDRLWHDVLERNPKDRINQLRQNLLHDLETWSK